MALLPGLLLGLLISITSTNCDTTCDDCVIITRCSNALNLVINDKSESTIDLLRSAHCGLDSGYPKVCCKHFMVGPRSLKDEFIVEQHPNVHLLAEECGDKDGNKIIGGHKALLYEFPWVVIIIHRSGDSFAMNCGGSLINSRYVLTAAHCIKGRKVAKVRIGEYDLSTENDCTGEDSSVECAPKYQEIEVSEQTHHEAYSDDPHIVNDIGLLRLKKPVDLTVRNAGLICLPVTNSLLSMDIYGERGPVVGWGIFENNTKSDVLLKVDVPVLSPKVCLGRHSRNARMDMDTYNRMRNMFCAGETGHDSCKGDSGGPLMLEGFIADTYKLVQFGIVSYGNTDCGRGPPALYTDVRKYMKWILDNIKA